MRFPGRVVAVLGGAGGIGRAAAAKFAAEGATVLVADVDGAAAAAVAAEITSAGGAADAATVDVTRFAEVDDALRGAASRHGRLDVLFNCAGTVARATLLEHEPDDFDRVVRVNLHGTYHGILAAGRIMRELRAPGCLVNTASVFAYTASAGTVGYHASKGGVRSLTSAAALELAPIGVRVIAVAPGAVDTPLLHDATSGGFGREVARRHMRRKLIPAERVADVVLFLASPEADAINGSVVLVDDGYVSFKA